MEQSRRRHRAGHPERAGAALERLAKSLGIDRTLEELRILEAWPTIVGERIASVAPAVKLENGILTVKVSTAPWRAELSMQRREIIAKVNSFAGTTVIKDIRFR